MRQRERGPHPAVLFSFQEPGHIQITVNGEAMEVEDGLSIDRLLDRLSVKREFTAVALNREVAPRSSYAQTRLQEGDRVEIVRPMGGG